MSTKLKWILSLGILGGVVWYFVHSSQVQVKENAGEKKIKFMSEMWDEVDSTLAHQYNCPLFKPELIKRTNSMFTWA